jgi:uncharacterized membrane protein YgcG
MVSIPPVVETEDGGREQRGLDPTQLTAPARGFRMTSFIFGILAMSVILYFFILAKFLSRRNRRSKPGNVWDAGARKRRSRGRSGCSSGSSDSGGSGCGGDGCGGGSSD